MPRPRTRTDVVTRDAGFAHRLRKAVEGVKDIPDFGQGQQQTWLRERLGVSAEAVRKWFSGEARPRPPMMKQLAALLDDSRRMMQGWADTLDQLRTSEDLIG